jgi:hypothetical protein
MSGGYQCRWCTHRAVVPSLIRDHETTCPSRPEETA